MKDKQGAKQESLSGNKENYSKGKHPNSIANLNPFPKGISGNPLGRPTKYENLKKVLKKLGDKHPDYFKDEEGTRRKQVWCRIWTEAMRGDIKYIQLLADWGCLDDE